MTPDRWTNRPPVSRELNAYNLYLKAEFSAYCLLQVRNKVA